MLINETDLIFRLGYTFTDIMREMQRQYPGETFTFFLASTAPEGNYERAEICFETSNEKEALFVSCIYNIDDATDGSIDEFYKEEKDKVINWVQLNGKS